MSRHPALFLTGGILALVIAMGIGRFAYTPILPLMQHDVSFSNAVAGYLASSNYAGYLVGAICAGVIPWKQRRTLYFRLSLILSIGTTASMGLSHSYPLWYTLRFLSGIASASVFVMSSSIVLDKLAAAGKTSWSGFFYGGVGLGIFFTGTMVPIFNTSFGWEGVWVGLAVISVIFAFMVWIWLKDEAPSYHPTIKKDTLNQVPPAQWLIWLIIAYGCEGLGYVVTGTFIVSISEKIPGFSGDARLVWIMVGLAAIPSCLIWSWLAKKWGFVTSLMVAMVIQSAGIILPVFWMSPAGAIVSALLFGATFMGITTLTITLAAQIISTKSSRVIGYFTAIYAIGQMIGPTGAGILSSFTQNYNTALIAAAAIVLAGACLLLTGIRFEKKCT